jgi:predicted O-methyltransferase YrrM
VTRFSEPIVFRPFDTPSGGAALARRLRHPVFAWLGLRPVFAQHTRGEHDALLRWAMRRTAVVEIGVAEGASACALRRAMSPEGVLYLVDPFPLSRFRTLNALRRTARAAVDRVGGSRVEWFEGFSDTVGQTWSKPIDFLFIDGDHDEVAVMRDWSDWSRFVVPGGVVAFHDARVFDHGWTTPMYGPVRAVNRLFRAAAGTRGWCIVDEVDSLVVVQRTEREP